MIRSHATLVGPVAQPTSASDRTASAREWAMILLSSSLMFFVGSRRDGQALVRQSGVQMPELGLENRERVVPSNGLRRTRAQTAAEPRIRHQPHHSFDGSARLPRATSRPFSPSAIILGIAPTRVATTGRPAAIASSNELACFPPGKAERTDRHCDTVSASRLPTRHLR